ncbi:hypothetical protein OsccyDRAFT_0682 [Leptolyngbyaceae cyanobacterium JSC-12]|nr:hypothetical protein OsccyDRAFT_0682 [Leptolyngbyaceae cyanobacterium JSC-12]
MDFTDRFIIATPALSGVDLETLTDEQLETLSPPVKDFSRMVREYSALLSRKGSKSIYLICTEQVDPRIALVLAGARDKVGVRLFPDLNSVKQVMFGKTDPSESAFVNAERNMFTQGVRRIAAALTAALLIGQLAQIEEQAKHSEFLEKSALADLQRLLEVPDIAVATAQKLEGEGEVKSFFFQPFSLELGSRILRAEFFMPSTTTSTWQIVNNYTGKFTTARIVADLADAINSYTLTQQTSNIIAAPILGDESTLYKIEFKARHRDASIACEVITARFTFTDNPNEPLPFKWGVSPAGLNDQFINSLLLAVQQGKASVVGVTAADRERGEPTVLYFKRAPKNSNGDILDYEGDVISSSIWGAQGNLTFRVSPMMDENVTLPVPYLTNVDAIQQTKLDAMRPNQVAELLLNQLFQIKGDTLALGALIRNDYPDNINALVALELIPFSVTNPEAWLILDLIDIPQDILVAVGNLQAPLTPFSSKPRSVRVESKFYAALAQNIRTTNQQVTAVPKVVKSPISDRLQAVRDDSTYRVLRRL